MINKKLDYYIFEGYDHYNNYPLYRVESTDKNDDEYVGEWNTTKAEAEKELNDLQADYEHKLNLRRNERFDNGGGVETFWGGIRGKLRIPMLSFEKVDYNVNVERKGTNNYEIDVNITKNDSVDSRKLYDVAEEVSQENWGYLIQVVSFEQLYETLKVLRVRVSKDKLFSWFNGKRYEDGGSVDEQNYIDLFEDYENIPAEVQMILDEYSESFEDGDYIGMSKAQNELEQIGYTFDFYVDGDAYGLRPINVKLSQIQGYEDEDEE